MSKKIVIIGTSAAGIACANRLRQLDAHAQIICISDEKEAPYNKCILADYLSEIKQEHELYTLTCEQARQKNIDLLLGHRVISIDPDERFVALENGQKIGYDSLVLAMGTSPAIPPIIKDNGLKAIFNFHRLRDIQAIQEYIAKHNVKSAIVIGAGLSGLECADSLMSLNIEVCVIEQQSRVLASTIDEQASVFIEHCMKKNNISFYTQTIATQLIQDNGFAKGIKLSSGQILQADILVFATGLKPNLSLLENKGINVTELGILTNEFMQTSIQNIYAAGDCILINDQLFEKLIPNRTWPEAMLQGIIAAHAICGQSKPYPGVSAIISSAFFGIKFAQCGIIESKTPERQEIIKKGEDFYHKFIIDQNCLKGFILVGQTDKLGFYRRALMTQAKICPADI